MPEYVALSESFRLAKRQNNILREVLKERARKREELPAQILAKVRQPKKSKKKA